MQVSLKSNETAPQLGHLFKFDLNELKPIKTNNNNKTGIRTKTRIIFPIKLIKKLTPTIGIIISNIKK
tara:strand:+ start:193 stop:396 length:204 start_codon:yes stop_codon:yes gene_type:complete